MLSTDEGTVNMANMILQDECNIHAFVVSLSCMQLKKIILFD